MPSTSDLVNFDRVLPNGGRCTVLVNPASVQAIAEAPDGHADLIVDDFRFRVVEGPHDAAKLLGLRVTGSLYHTIVSETERQERAELAAEEDADERNREAALDASHE